MALIAVHDSILTTPPHVSTVMFNVHEEYDSVGLRPKFGVVEYDSENSSGDTGVVAAA